MSQKSYGIAQEKTDSIMSAFIAPEGQNSVYYGKTRQGKTRTATADILELLKRGETVIANWDIKFDGYDERKDFKAAFFKAFTNRLYYVFDNSNFHYVDPISLIDGTAQMNIKFLNRVVGAHIFIDEGQWVLPSQDRSYDEEQIAKMKLVLHGGHYCRSLNIITQRPTNISVNTRSQINVWYRCTKRFEAFGYILFQRFAIEDMKSDVPIEFDDEGRPIGERKTYLCHKKSDPVFRAYNTHAMRQKDAIMLPIEFEAYKLSKWERIKLVALFCVKSVIPARFLKDRAGG